jgi:hypothetical protein
MSVVRMLTRMCAVAALRGETWADERVFDSDNTPLSQALTSGAGAKPYIVIYTDGDGRANVDGTDLFNVDRELALVLEMGVASKVEGETGEAVIKTPLTDEGMEIALDMLENQVMGVLFADPRNPWGEILKSLVMRVTRVSGQRGASAERDKRWAARQLSIICDVISDLPPGVPVPEGHPIREFIRVSKLNPGMEHAGDICVALVSQDVAPKWEQIQAKLGIRRHTLRGIGLAPLSSDLPTMATPYGEDLTDPQGEAPILREIGHDDVDMNDDPEHGLIDMYTIRTNVVKIAPKEPKDKVEADGEVP